MTLFVPRNAGHLDALQAGRAVAALSVVLYHANNFTIPLRLYDGQTVWIGFGMGYSGVEFFFVLSGFIMIYVHSRDFNYPSSLGKYLRKRAARIYPIYWVVLVALILLYQVADGLAPEALSEPRVVVTSIFLIPDPQRTILPVAWTLKHEIVFYAVFAVFLVNVRLALAIFALWAGGCLVAMFPPQSSFPVDFILSPYNLLFVAGLLVGRFYRALPAAAALPLLGLGIVGFLAVGMSEQYGINWSLPIRTLGYGLAATASIAALARGAFAVPLWAVFLGDASYSLYLVHLPAMNLLAVPVGYLNLQDWLSPPLMFCILVGFAVAAGAAFHLVVERPLLARLATAGRSLAARQSREVPERSN